MSVRTLTEFNFESQTTYTFVEEIGRGGMGIVYLASRNSGGVADYVVLKTLKTLNDQDEKALRQEANLAAQLRHENIVKTYGLESIPLSALPGSFLENLGALSYVKSAEGQERKQVRRINFKRHKGKKVAHIDKGVGDGEKRLLLMVMDYIDGINLNAFHYEHVYQSLLIPIYLGAFIISRMARALSYAHKYLIHRDISPENILLNTQGICKLSDFGIAVASRQQPDYWAGKLTYMAPEQLFDRPIDERIDIFSLGCVAYQLLTGIPLVYPIPRLNLEEQINSVKKQLATGIIAPHEVRQDIPPELSEIVKKMLAVNPEQRYQRAISVAGDLEKNFLYAKGYGPTNNSLATYMAIFENRFTMYNEDQLEQLSFLKGSKGEVEIRRTLEADGYTEKGLALIEQRKDSEIYKQLQARERIKQMVVVQQERRRPYLKVKYLDNVIESLAIDQYEDITVGNAEAMIVRLEDPDIDEHHATIRYCDGTVLLQATGPDAEVKINNKIFEQKELREGDKIKLGDHVMFFIKQSALPQTSPEYIFDLEQSPNLEEISTHQNFAVNFRVEQQHLTMLARLAEHILVPTNLSELKLGVIPTALMEAIQLLKTGGEGSDFQLRIIKTTVRLIFNCTGLTPAGYTSLLSNFRKHSRRLAQEFQQKEEAADRIDASQSFSVEEDLLSSGVRTTPVVSPTEVDAEPDIDIDIDSFEPSMLAAMLIIHGFDRIEFKRQNLEVELIVYL